MTTPQIIRFPERQAPDADPVVITGIGMGASVGSHREAVWQAIQTGRSGIRFTRPTDCVGSLRLPCAMVDWLPPKAPILKSIRLCHAAADEALRDAEICWPEIDRDRFAVSIAAQFGDIDYLYLTPEQRSNPPDELSHPWHQQFLPCSISEHVANYYGLNGPRLCHATACASGIVSTLAATRMIQADQADMALAGASDAVAEIILAAFHRMGVLAESENAASACRPFDKSRNGFVMGEGAALLVLEKRSHAIARGAKIYAEIASGQMLCQAHHVTGLEENSSTLEQLIRRTVDKAGWSFRGPQYVNAHGTGTTQNDVCELQALRSALGDLADHLVASSNKAILGHLINAAGSIELALTALAMRDNFAPPTMHLHDPEPVGAIDCLPEYGVQMEIDRALKLSLAFGGHLVAMALRKCPLEAHQRSALPLSPQARIRNSSNSSSIKRAA